MSSGARGSSIQTNPASWLRSWRTVTAPLPFSANCGQYSATGASKSIAGGCATATPQVDHLLSTPICSDCGADLAALGEVALELVAHLLEA
jgi:hypothetical protein